MKKLLISLVVASIMFAASAAASWKWQQKRAAEAAAQGQQQASDGAEEPETESSTPPIAQEQPAPASARRRAMETANAKPGLVEQRDSPTSSQSAYAAGLEDTVQVTASLRERMSAVRERENQLAQRQAQVELILKDIRAQRSDIDELRKQVNEEFKLTEEQLATVERQRTQIDAQKQSLQDRVTELDGVEREGTKRLASVYDGMASDRAAKILEHMVNSGKMDTAVQLLGVMKERQAAKVLGEFEDTSLAAQLSERLKGLKKPVALPKG